MNACAASLKSMDKAAVRSRIFRERTIWDLLLCYQSGFPKPLSAFWHAALAFVCCLATVWTALFFAPPSFGSKPSISYEDIQKLLAVLSGSGMTIGIGSLSVAIAGFAIFATTLEKQALSLMIRKDQPGTNTPILVFVYATFVYVMATLLLLSFTSLLISLIAYPESPLWNLVRFVAPESLDHFAAFLLSAYVAQFVFVFSILKSFIWNLYQIMLSLSAYIAIDKDD
ncbi:hypothetical protein EYE35_12690 [Cereibacter sphaeroides]|nr:hypothetical protein EYE35_12690 [Cereibacter sphaeroides]